MCPLSYHNLKIFKVQNLRLRSAKFSTISKPVFNQKMEEPKSNDSKSSKGFSKAQFTYYFILLFAKYNPETGKFEKLSTLHTAYRVLLILWMAAYPLRLTLSYFYPKKSVAQLYIGNVYNALNETSRFYLSFVVCVLVLGIS